MLERFRATSQMLENTRPSTPLSSPWKPSSRLDFAMEQTKDWNRESAWVSSTVAPAPRRPSGSMPPAWITSAGLQTGKHATARPPGWDSFQRSAIAPSGSAQSSRHRSMV